MMEWNIGLSCYHDEIDNQHRKLIEIINKVSATIVEENYNVNKVLEVVSDLADYIVEHLHYEEDLIEQYGFTETKEHLSQHNELRKKLQSMNIFDVSNHEEYFSDLLIYLVEWLTEHIMKTDKNLGLFLAGKAKVDTES